MPKLPTGVRRRGDSYQAYWQAPDGKGGKKPKSRTFETAKEASAYRIAQIARINNGAWSRDAKISMRDLLNDWLAVKASQGLRQGTLDTYRNDVEGWVIPHVGHLRLDQISPAAAQQMVDVLRSPEGSRHGRGAVSARSVQIAVLRLTAATKWAADTGLCSRDPLTGFKKPRAPESTRAATSVWSAAEVRQFLAYVENNRYRAMWWLLLSRGLRRGELAALKWRQVDLEGGVIYVVKGRTRNGLEEVKTNAGRRPVGLDPLLVSELRRHRAQQHRDQMAAKEWHNDEDYVFVDEVGTLPAPNTFARTFKRLSREAGMPPIRFHDGRHTAATLLLTPRPGEKGGEDPKVVSLLLGHANESTTREIYQHVQPGETAAAGARLTALITQGV